MFYQKAQGFLMSWFYSINSGGSHPPPDATLSPAHRYSGASDQLHFELNWVPCDGKSMEAWFVTLKLIVGPGDQGDPVITIMMPNED